VWKVFEKEHARGDGMTCEVKCPRAEALGNPLSLQRSEVPISCDLLVGSNFDLLVVPFFPANFVIIFWYLQWKYKVERFIRCGSLPGSLFFCMITPRTLNSTLETMREEARVVDLKNDARLGLVVGVHNKDLAHCEWSKGVDDRIGCICNQSIVVHNLSRKLRTRVIIIRNVVHDIGAQPLDLDHVT